MGKVVRGAECCPAWTIVIRIKRFGGNKPPTWKFLSWYIFAPYLMPYSASRLAPDDSECGTHWRPGDNVRVTVIDDGPALVRYMALMVPAAIKKKHCIENL